MTGKAIRKLVNEGKMPEDVARAVRKAYAEFSKRNNAEDADAALF